MLCKQHVDTNGIFVTQSCHTKVTGPIAIHAIGHYVLGHGDAARLLGMQRAQVLESPSFCNAHINVFFCAEHGDVAGTHWVAGRHA